MELARRVAFITGSAGGIGKDFARGLLEKGAKVFMSDVDKEAGAAALAEFKGKFGAENVRFGKLDVTNEKNFEDVFQEAIGAFGPIDIMINNAGVIREDRWQHMININLVGSIKGTKLAEEHMRKDKGGKGGRIINVSSFAALMDSCTVPVYCATKHGLRSFTMSQATRFDLEALGIQYALICPGGVATNLLSQLEPRQVHFPEVFNQLSGDQMPVSQVTDSLTMLLQLEQMNGAIVKVMKDSITFQKMVATELGTTYKSSLE